MNIDDIKIYGGFIASMIATIADIETILKIIVFLVTIIYTIYKIIDLQETRKRNKKNDEIEKINNIVLHCSAGYSSVESIENFWSKTLNWKGKGYHIIIDLDGTTYYLKNDKLKNGYSKNPKDVNFNITTNGVLGYNSSTIHICYIGGVEKNNVNKAFDSRTKEQKDSVEKAIQLTLHWLRDNGKDITKNLGLVGHRDFSIDNNSNGVIESHERIKECPSYDVIGSVEHYLYSSKDRYNKLPYDE